MLSRLKKVLKKNFGSFYFFYRFLRLRIFFSLSFSLAVGILDGFGLAMFLPLLQTVDSKAHASSSYDTEQMGNLSFLLEWMQGAGIDLTLTSILIVMLVFFIFKGIFKFIEGYTRVLNQRFFIKKLRFSNIDLLGSYSYKSFVLSDTGRIQNTFSAEVERVVTAYRSYTSALQYAILVFVYIFLAFLANAEFAILVVFGAGFTNTIYKKVYKTTKRLSKELTKENHSFQGLLIQNIAFFKYLKATNFLTAYGEKLKYRISEIEKHAKKIGLLSSAMQGLREPVVVSVVIAVILLQVNVRGESLSSIVLSLLFFYRSLTFLMTVQNHWNTYLAASGSLDNMMEFAQELKANAERKGRGNYEGFSQQIQVENVGLFYGDTQVLKNINLQIKKNQTIALVGESGSGKTTLVNILSGLMLPDEGEVKIDGTSLKTINRNLYQQRIGYITQDPVIFNDTIFNNVTLWAEDNEENRARFYRALDNAAILQFVNELPGKGNAMLGHSGIMVSGGQKQRLSIARELFKEVDLLFLDEATSALDAETERFIQQNLDRLKGKYTIIVIAHRLSTVRNADVVFLLSKGAVVASGSFEELINKSGDFKRMVQLQGL